MGRVVVPIQSGSSRQQYPGSYFQGFFIYIIVHWGVWSSRFNRDRHDNNTLVHISKAFSFISLFIGACGRPDKNDLHEEVFGFAFEVFAGRQSCNKNQNISLNDV